MCKGRGTGKEFEPLIMGFYESGMRIRLFLPHMIHPGSSKYDYILRTACYPFGLRAMKRSIKGFIQSAERNTE
jgi:hypothetical protein